MRFETNPQLILNTYEFKTLENALELCRDMDERTGQPDTACTICPFQDDCSRFTKDCVYEQAHKALKKIIDIAIVK